MTTYVTLTTKFFRPLRSSRNLFFNRGFASFVLDPSLLGGRNRGVG